MKNLLITLITITVASSAFARIVDEVLVCETLAHEPNVTLNLTRRSSEILFLEKQNELNISSFKSKRSPYTFDVEGKFTIEGESIETSMKVRNETTFSEVDKLVSRAIEEGSEKEVVAKLELEMSHPELSEGSFTLYCSRP